MKQFKKVHYRIQVRTDTTGMVRYLTDTYKGLEFFGKVTKPYSTKKDADDADNGKYHTLPVKMMFKDKDAKARAEKVFRTNCKVNCTTPYPVKLRSAIKQTIESQKASFPNEFIQVKVDPEAAVLRVSRCFEGKWKNNRDTIVLSEMDMDLSNSRQVEATMDLDEAGSQQTL